ncbi:MAG: hypothetical protein ACE5GR_06545 [Nitrosopumilus sp.]
MKTNSKYITAIVIPLLAFALLSMSFGDAYAHKMDVAGDYKIEIGWDDEPPIQGMENAIEFVVTHATEADKMQAEKMHEMMGMGNNMHMQKHNEEDIGDKIIPILSQFDSDKITSSVAISQISKIVNEQEPSDSTGKEIKNLIDDAQSNIITNDDAIYALIDMLGTVQSSNMDHSNMTHDNEHNMNEHGSMKSEDHDEGEGIPGLENTVNITVTIKDKTKMTSPLESQIDGIYHGKFTPASTGYPVVHISGMIHDTKVDLDMHPEEVEPLSTLSPLKQISHGIDPSDVQCKEVLELFMRTHEDTAICASNELGQKLMELGIVDYY